MAASPSIRACSFNLRTSSSRVRLILLIASSYDSGASSAATGWGIVRWSISHSPGLFVAFSQIASFVPFSQASVGSFVFASPNALSP